MSFVHPFARVAPGARPASRFGRVLSLAFLSATLVAAAACGDDDDDGGPTAGGGVAGSYDVVSVTGPSGTDNSAPFLMVAGTFEDPETGATSDFRVEINSGTVELDGDGTYTAEFDTQFYVDDVPQPGFETESESGTYTVSGSTITFTDADGETSTATIDNGRISRSQDLDLDEDGVTDAEITIVVAK